MALQKRIVFDDFCLDLADECLWRGAQVIKLRPKAIALLGYLLGHAGQLLTKEELLNAVWPGVFVGEAVLKAAIGEIRGALDDDSTSPRFIETAHRRGYRFIGRIAGSGPVQRQVQRQVQREDEAGYESQQYPYAAVEPQQVVGREEALSQMRSWLEKTIRGERQVVFVTGEAGIGKTALIDTFARTIAAGRRIRITRGQCLEQYGTSEAYLPVLEAIGRVCRQEHSLVDVLRAHAPMWLLQMPSLVSASDRNSLSREVVGATRERMLREMGEALEALTADVPLVLMLEDLHWSDYSTLDLISYVASQRQAARLMLIGTYRPVELIISGHPLKAVKRELLARQQCEELPLDYLSREAVAEYLSTRFPAHRFPSKLTELIHARTEGNPLFMVSAVDYLLAEGSIAENKGNWDLAEAIENVDVGVPESIKQMIEKQVDHLDANDQRLLEVASVAGAEFLALGVVAGLRKDRTLVEASCDALAHRQHFIRDCGIQILPDGEAVSRYGFIHALYQNVLYERLSASTRVQLHRRIGAHMEALFHENAREIAAELAMHFEYGADYQKAAEYLRLAADNAVRRFAYREGVELSRRGLELLARLPDTVERARQELRLQLTLGVPLIATEGYAAPDVGRAYLKARELYQRVGETPDVSEVLWGLRSFYTLRSELGMAREIGEEFLRLAERLPYSGLAMRGHWSLESTFTHLGEFPLAMEHFEKALLLYDPEQHLDDAFLYALNPGVAMQCFAAWALWFLGQPDQSLARLQKALTLARELSEPLSLAYALSFSAILHQLRREEGMAQEQAEAAIAVSSGHGLVMFQAMATIIRAWALVRQSRTEEAIEQMRQGLADLRATGTELFRPHFLGLLAEALDKARQVGEGLRVLEEAMTEAHNGERYYQAELYRLKGELLLNRPTAQVLSRAARAGQSASKAESSATVASPESYFHQSIEIARQQGAKSFELRAVLSLARLHHKNRKRKEVRSLLAQIYGSFTEGFDTPDLREAKALLEMS